MYKEQFAEVFKDSPQYRLQLPGNSVRSRKRTLINPALHWADVFSYMVDSHLTDTTPEGDLIRQTLTDYESHATKQLLQNTTLTSENVAFAKPNFSPHLNALNFHILSQGMMANWWNLMGASERAPDCVDITRMQTHLSIQGLRLAKSQRDHRELARSLEEPLDKSYFDEALTGQITEIDAAITLLEVTKQLPSEERANIAVVPGPPRYESNSRAASDFLMFDIERHQARGIQVKTNIRHSGRYDLDYVSMVNGISDLQNYEKITTPDGKVKKQALPGLVAADFALHNYDLANLSASRRNNPFTGLHGQIAKARETAREVFPEYSDINETRAEKAAEKIGRRILSDLYDSASVL